MPARITRCKFTCQAVTPTSEDPLGPATVEMQAVYCPEVAEDKSFSTMTPWGSLRFGIANPALEGFFKPGRTYYLDISDASE